MIYIDSSSLRLVDCMDWVSNLTLKGKKVERTTLNVVYSVMYYLQLHNVVSILCISQILPTNVK
jgi:hypothetical protein